MAEKDLAAQITEITLKKSYNALPLIPPVKTGNPFAYAASHGLQKPPQTNPASPKASGEPQRATQK